MRNHDKATGDAGLAAGDIAAEPQSERGSRYAAGRIQVRAPQGHLVRVEGGMGGAMIEMLIKVYVTLLGILMVFICVVAFLATEQPVAAAPVDVEECVKWRQAGPWLIYVCEDTQLGVICIESESGFQSCKWEE